MKSDNTSEPPVFELKGSVLTVMVLYIKEPDPERFYPQLEKKIGQARSFFNNAPVLIDLKALDDEAQSALDFLFLADTLRGLNLVPVGVRGVAAYLQEQVLRSGLGLLPAVKAEKTVTLPEEKPPVVPEPAKENIPEPPKEEQPVAAAAVEENKTPSAAPTKVITQPVRSGQQVFAPHGDLVILSSVNAGAEVLAAGNIHIYGVLRGRALAGINGDTSARIFSLQCNPELVAVAGEYVVNELLDKRVLNQSVIISLELGGLKFDALGSFDPHS
jgi:septum site-determining protein MinC